MLRRVGSNGRLVPLLCEQCESTPELARDGGLVAATNPTLAGG